METIAGYTATGRQLRGPASDLIELSAQNGLRLTAIVFHPEYRSHRALNEALDVVRGFLESPLVTNLSELTAQDRDAGAFVYPTGQCWSVAEVIRALADIGQSEGHVRAGLELMLAAGEILIEAAERGEMDGVYSHGGVTPWRLMLKKDGQVTVIGHALPQVEILQFHEDDSRIPREDSFRYCPPERIEFAPENISSDLFGLSLIAFELMTGRPVYDGLVNDIRQQAARGEGSRRLFRFRDKLPKSVRDLLTTALRPDMGDRYPAGEDFLRAVRQVLSGPDAAGDSLMDLMKKVASRGKRTGQALQSSKTLMVDKDKLRSMLDEADAAEEEAPARQKWSAPTRSRREAPRTRPAEDLPPQPPVVADDPPTISKPKWSKPTRRRQPSPRTSEPDVQVEVTPPQRPRSTADNAADLLARLRASSTSASPQHASTAADARRSDADLVSAILRDSGPPPETTDAAISAGTPIPEPGPRIIPGRRRPPTRKPVARSPEDIARLISQSMANNVALASHNEEEKAEAQAAAEEAARKKAAEEAAQKEKAAAEEAARKKAAARKRAEAAAQQKKAAEEAAQKKAAAEAAQKKAAAEAAQKKAAAEAAQKKAAAEAAQKKAAAEAAAQKKAAAEAARKKAAAAQQAEIDRELMKELQAAAAAAQQKAAAEQRQQEASAARELATLRAEKERAEAEVVSLRRELAAAQKQRSVEISAAVQAEVARLLREQAAAGAGQVASLKRAVLDAVRAAPRPPPSGGDEAFPLEVAAAVAGQAGFSGTGQLVRAPDSISMSSSREGVASFNFQRGPGGRTVRIRLPLSASAGEAIAWLLGSVLPMRADLQGHISGWYRIEHDGRIFPASRRLGELDAQQTYMLRFVPNQTVHADIDASASGAPVRFVAPVGVAVPAITLVDHLAAWLGLPAGEWGIEANGQLLGTYGIVHDVIQGEGLVRLRLVRRGAR